MNRPLSLHGDLNRHGRKAIQMRLKAAIKESLRPLIGQEINQSLIQNIRECLDPRCTLEVVGDQIHVMGPPIPYISISYVLTPDPDHDPA